jgi:hypothetical protein
MNAPRPTTGTKRSRAVAQEFAESGDTGLFRWIGRVCDQCEGKSAGGSETPA